MANKSINHLDWGFGISLEDEKNSDIITILDSLVDTDDLNKNDFFKKVFEGVFTFIPEAEKGSFFELSEDKYVPVFAKGYDLDLLKKLEFDISNFFIGFEYLNHNKIEVYQTYVKEREEDKFDAETLEIFKKLGTLSGFTILYAPILIDNLNVGLISLECFNKIGFSQGSMKVLKFYTKMISDFYRQKLNYYKQTKLYDEIISALIAAIEIKDKYTVGHARRVKEYSSSIAMELKLSQAQIAEITTAALLHDIGKIGIPESILNKPGKLTEEEYNLIKMHPAYTKDILQNVNEFSRIANFAYCHHENFDGTGYPQGLRGSEIPFEAQIIQVADAFDAMTSERAYRKALSTEEALKIIEEEMGKQFNPQVAKAAINYFKTNEKLK